MKFLIQCYLTDHDKVNYKKILAKSKYVFDTRYIN